MDPLHFSRHTHRTTIDVSESAVCSRKRWSLPQALADLCDVLDELIIHLLVHYEALGASAILTTRLESAPQSGWNHITDLCILQDDHGIFSAQFQCDWREVLGGSGHHPLTDRSRPDESHVSDSASNEGATTLGVTRNNLYQVTGRASCRQGSRNDASIVQAGPTGMLGNLDHQPVACKHVCQQWVEHVVEWVVPWNNGCCDANRMILHTCTLVEHHLACLAVVWFEHLFAPSNEPTAFLQCHDHLPESSIDQRFATVASGDATDLLRMVNDEAPHYSDEHPSLLPTRSLPLLLCDARLGDGGLHLLRTHRWQVRGTVHPHRRRVVARDPVLRVRGPSHPIRLTTTRGVQLFRSQLNVQNWNW
mmetsp:Transcript_17326/g.47023  ORF Transcript_17326/g.47023 Transcript_17326/m.47023 type:complete len:363 (+) Transcript_17326:773-1861(+)